MCGRFGFDMPRKRAAEVFHLESAPEYAPRRNVAPGTDIFGVAPSPQDAGRSGYLFRWGLIPSWAKDARIGYKLINARSESAAEKPSFRAAFKRRRCLIPAQCFYEWKKLENKGEKQPYAIGMHDRAPFAMAGLWESWESPDGQVVLSTTILTTAPNELLAPIHNRMPVILPPETYDAWLAPDATGGELETLLVPFPAHEMLALPVDARVGSPKNQDFDYAFGDDGP